MSVNPKYQWDWTLVEEYAPIFVHIKGIHNIVADDLSRLDADFDVKLNNKQKYD